MASHTEENYLKTIVTLEGEREKVKITDLSKRLHITLPTANSMIRNLKKKGLVNYKKYRPVTLTKKGRKAAALVLRRHRLTEMFLVTKMGFGWEEVHVIAEQIEHIDSPVFFNRMDELLGFPETDPHGSPIPDKSGNILPSDMIALYDCKAGDSVVIGAILNDSNTFLNLLNDKQLKLGTRLTITNIEAYDQTMTISYDGHKNVAISDKVSSQILVKTA